MELRKTMKQIHLTKQQQLREVANEIGVTIPHAEKALLGSPVGVGRDTVREALGGLTKSQLADDIRKLAVEEFGGVAVPGDK